MGYLDDTGLAHFYDGLKNKFVRTVNGVPPVNGNVNVSTAGNVVTEFTIDLDTSDWNSITDTGVWQAVTIPGSSPTDTVIIDRAMFDDSGVDQFPYYPIKLGNTVADGYPQALAESGDQLWVVYYENGGGSVSYDLSVHGYLLHGSSGSGYGYWFGNGIKRSSAASSDCLGTIFKSVSASKDNITVAKNNVVGSDITFTLPSGYKAVAIRSLRLMNATNSGVNCSMCTAYDVLISAATTLHVSVRNHHETAAAKIKIQADILCVPNRTF